MKRLLLLPAIALATFLPAQQNVLLVVADDLGLDPVPGYLSGPQKATMPTLASLMDDGLTFDQAWASPVCSPTRATIMTGRTGNETGVLGVDTLNTLLPSETTLFRVPGPAGAAAMRCPLIGKWHLGGTQPALDDPAQQGCRTSPASRAVACRTTSAGRRSPMARSRPTPTTSPRCSPTAPSRGSTDRRSPGSAGWPTTRPTRPSTCPRPTCTPRATCPPTAPASPPTPALLPGHGGEPRQ